jgi:hypothetical protein
VGLMIMILMMVVGYCLEYRKERERGELVDESEQ